MVMANTVEERVRAIQDKKRVLIEQAFAGIKHGKQSVRKRLEELKTLLDLNES